MTKNTPATVDLVSVLNRRRHRQTRIAALTLSALLALSTLYAGPAMAASSSTSCAVRSVGWQVSDPASPNIKYLYIGCADSSIHLLYLTSTNPACNADIDSLRQLQALAVAARLSGKLLSIFWNQTTCQPNSSVRLIGGAELD
jgi:hypothetical protein